MLNPAVILPNYYRVRPAGDPVVTMPTPPSAMTSLNGAPDARTAAQIAAQQEAAQIALQNAQAAQSATTSAASPSPATPVVFVMPQPQWWQSGMFAGTMIAILGLTGYAVREHYKQGR